jgi:hypothetical protein
MPILNDSRIANALRAAVDSVLPLNIALHPPKPASTRTNLPEPASQAPAQNKPTTQPSGELAALRYASIPTVRRQNEPTAARLNPPQPAQTCTNLPSSAPPQNEPTVPRYPLNPRQLRAARLLVAGQTARAVAATLGVDPHTVSEWKKRPDFRAEVARLLAASDPPLPRR